MSHTDTIWVAGGDRRQVELARLLALDGHTVHTFALGDRPEPDTKNIEKARCVIFPLPVSTSPGLLNAPAAHGALPLEEIFRCLSPGQILLGGRVDETARTLAHSRGLTIHDYLLREELAVANAVPTAEGAIQLAMEHLPITVHGARVLVLGFGRVGKVTAQRFAALGARVCVAARNPEQLAWAGAMGPECTPLSELGSRLPHCDLIINTIPSPVLGAKELELVPPDCLLLELASAPGGVDASAAAKLGKTLIQAPGLPGKVAPVTAARAIKTTIYHMLRELGQ